MNKIFIIAILSIVTLADASAGNGKSKKEDNNIKVDIHIDKSGNLEINGKNFTDKDVEKWVNDHLKNISINITDDSDDKAPGSDKAKHKKEKSKTVELSVKITEK